MVVSFKTLHKTVCLGIAMLLIALPVSGAERLKISRDMLRDKIRGGWAGQVIGCTYGGPTEFQYQGRFIPDEKPLAWTETAIPEAFKKSPGLYDDVYMELTFLDVLAKRGLDASAAELGRAFAEAPFPLWHANQAARWNILNGVLPPRSGHWLNNPHADDIDFQIEADFAGLISPGMVGAASRLCDRVGHIMNSGDGFYGGVYIAAMYALAFTTDDVTAVVRDGLRAIPAQSDFARCLGDVIRWHAESPDDWHETWSKVMKAWGQDVGCPEGVFSSFNIDAKINAAWVAMGLLYGNGDFERTLSVSARCGDDSDCNPASAGGILGTVLGRSRIPAKWVKGVEAVEGEKFPYTSLSLVAACDLTFALALESIRRQGGRVEGGEVEIPRSAIRAVRFERNFEGLRPTEKRRLDLKLGSASGIEFSGTGFCITGQVSGRRVRPAGVQVSLSIDGAQPETISLPTDPLRRRDPLFWRYGLRPGRHRLELKVVGGATGAEVLLRDLVVYGTK